MEFYENIANLHIFCSFVIILDFLIILLKIKDIFWIDRNKPGNIQRKMIRSTNQWLISISKKFTFFKYFGVFKDNFQLSIIK